MELPTGRIPTLLLLLALLSGGCSTETVNKCYGDYYVDPPAIQCTSPAVISITGGKYGVSTCPGETTCCPLSSDCTVAMESNDEHLQYVKSMCDGNRGCPTAARAGRKANIDCGSGPRELSDYVTINYNCLTDGDTTPSLTTTPVLTSDGSTPPTSATSTPSSNNSTTVSPTVPPRGGLSAGAIVGIVFGVILGVLLILFIIFAILVRRKNPNWPQTHNWKEPFKDYKSYIPDRVTSVVNRVTRRPQEDPKSQYAPKVTVTDTSRNYQDASMAPGKYQSNHNSDLPPPTLQQTNPGYHDVTLHAVPSGDSNALTGGVQIVRTPQDAIDESSGVPPGAGIEEEPMYETIDDFTRGGSVYSLRRADSYDSFESIPMEDNNMYDRAASKKASPNKMKINDAIYYGALEGDKSGNLEAENSLYDKSSERGSTIPASPKVGRMTNLGNGKPQEENPTSKLSAPSSPKPGYKTIPPKSGVKPMPGSPKAGLKNPTPNNSKPPASPKPTRNVPNSRGATQNGDPPAVSGDEPGQVYMNTDFEPEQDTYYNAGDVPSEGRYSRLDPSTASRTAKGEAYQTLSVDPTQSSSC